ncbi:lipoprotein insertase outer membrane protein LolB [Agaribacter flavus]|uniref:Outer-membrane lipoprotein LolB n=1 Tax=Agaribacter flavus TaxID=1902781 RepID=A0ABV7FP27_9ALTE
MWLTACAIKPEVSETSPVIANQSLPDAWKLSGKLAVITPEERKSAYLSWQQKNQTFDMALTTIVGSSVANMSFDGNIAILEADGKKWQDVSPDKLIENTTSWSIPVSSIAVWMSGQSEPRDSVSFYENGLIKSLIPSCIGCEVWQITYNSYRQYSVAKHNLVLPHKLTLKNSSKQTQVIIRIDKWQAE